MTETAYVPDLTTRIVVVDDDASVRETLRWAFTESGMSNLAFACNGQEGLELILEDPSVGLIITDRTMPKMNGDEMVCQIRQLRRNLSQPAIIMVSSDIDSPDWPIPPAGINALLKKPLDLELFLLLVKYWLPYKRVLAVAVGE